MYQTSTDFRSLYVRSHLTLIVELMLDKLLSLPLHINLIIPYHAVNK